MFVDFLWKVTPNQGFLCLPLQIAMTSLSSNRIPSLDGLHTISICLVIASHLGFSFGLVPFFNVGDLGVRIFFVISGFLITRLLVKEHDRQGSINLWRF